jgi:hypothetical protein
MNERICVYVFTDDQRRAIEQDNRKTAYTHLHFLKACREKKRRCARIMNDDE